MRVRTAAGVGAPIRCDVRTTGRISSATAMPEITNGGKIPVSIVLFILFLIIYLPYSSLAPSGAREKSKIIFTDPRT